MKRSHCGLVDSQNFPQPARLQVSQLEGPKSERSSPSGRDSAYKVRLASSGLVFYRVQELNK